MSSILKLSNIVLNQAAETPDEAIKRCGEMLLKSGYINERYIEGMLARDHSFSTAIGNFIAIPHGEKDYKNDILSTGLVVITYPDGIDWNGQKVHLVIGIAAIGEEHLDILGNVVDKLEDGDDVINLIQKNDQTAIYNLLCGEGEET